jgi:short subunit dehydrogenase-like uncharacterized protein
MSTSMIYGATGYAGRMAAGHAKGQGLDVVVAGRNAEKLLVSALKRLAGSSEAVSPRPSMAQPSAISKALQRLQTLRHHFTEGVNHVSHTFPEHRGPVRGD